jgi:hypothetical protein
MGISSLHIHCSIAKSQGHVMIGTDPDPIQLREHQLYSEHLYKPLHNVLQKIGVTFSLLTGLTYEVKNDKNRLTR